MGGRPRPTVSRWILSTSAKNQTSPPLLWGWAKGPVKKIGLIREPEAQVEEGWWWGEGVATSKLFRSLIRQCGLLKDSNTTANSSFQSNCPAQLSWIPSNYSQHRLSGVEIIMKNILSIYVWLLAAVKCPVIQYSQGCLPCLCRSWFKQPIRSTALRCTSTIMMRRRTLRRWWWWWWWGRRRMKMGA